MRLPEGDYELTLEDVLHVAPREALIQVQTNRSVLGLSMIVVSLTIVQVGIHFSKNK